jgi:hypothetical protein
MNGFSLAHLTVLALPPPEMVGVAARTGYQAVGLRLIEVTPDSPGYPLMDDAACGPNEYGDPEANRVVRRSPGPSSQGNIVGPPK